MATVLPGTKLRTEVQDYGERVFGTICLPNLLAIRCGIKRGHGTTRFVAESCEVWK